MRIFTLVFPFNTPPIHRSLIIALAILTTTVPIPYAWAIEDPLIMGVFPRRNAMMTITMFKPMTSYLSQQLGREVKLETSKNLKTFWRGIREKHYDIVHFNQYQYIKAHKESGYQVFLKNEEFGNRSISGSLVVRKDSGINRIEDLRGKKVIFGGGPAAMISYIVPTWLMRQAGLKQGDYIETFAKNPPHSVLVVYHQQAAAAGASHLVIQFPVINQKIDTSQLKILAKSQALPSLPWAVTKAMNADLRHRIQTLLIDLKNTEQGRTILDKAALTALNPATDQEFNIHRDIVLTVTNEDYGS